MDSEQLARKLAAATTISLHGEPSCLAFLHHTATSTPRKIMKLRIGVSNMDFMEGKPIIWLNLEIYTKDWDPEWVTLMEFDALGFDRFVRQFCFAAPPSANTMTPTNFDGARHIADLVTKREMVSADGEIAYVEPNAVVFQSLNTHVIIAVQRTNSELVALFHLPRSDRFVETLSEVVRDATAVLLQLQGQLAAEHAKNARDSGITR